MDPVHLAAELEVWLKDQGISPGAGYRPLEALAAVETYLRAADIPMAGAA
ncbi:hypothetical protein [Plantactinospora sp. WMMB782]